MAYQVLPPPRESPSDLCLSCGHQSPNLTAHHLHLRRHSLFHDNEFSCVDCGQEFKYAAGLRKHRALKHDPAVASAVAADPRCVCETCGKRFANVDNKRRHVSTVHEKILPKGCSLCEKRFVDVSALEAHLNSKHRESDKQFACELCSKQYKLHESLVGHMRRAHKDEKQAAMEDGGGSLAANILVSGVSVSEVGTGGGGGGGGGGGSDERFAEEEEEEHDDDDDEEEEEEEEEEEDD